MIKYDSMEKELVKNSGVDKLITNDSAKDYQLIHKLKERLNDENVVTADKAYLGLTYLQLFHKSALVRHEAIFVIGEYGPRSTFLTYSALSDPEPVVRHEACLALGGRSQRVIALRRLTNLEYIAKNDKSEMVRDSARVALDNIRNFKR